MSISTPGTLKGLCIIAAILLSGCLWIWNSGGNSDFDEIAYAQSLSSTEFISEYLDVGDVTLHVVFAGPKDGEPIVLLHGFPATWFIWRKHIEILANAGYRVAAADLRGYNRSDKPSNRRDYNLDAYANDIIGLLDSQGWQKANIVGHDVGAHILWWLIFEEPERIDKAVIYSVPHPLAQPDHSATIPRQTYKAFFNLPIIPELTSRAGGLSLVSRNLTKNSRLGTFSPKDIDVLKASWDRDHAFTTMIGSYRTKQVLPPSMTQDGKPSVPVKYYFGAKDSVIHSSLAKNSQPYLEPLHIAILDELGHWLIAEEPEMTAADIADFVSNKGSENAD